MQEFSGYMCYFFARNSKHVFLLYLVLARNHCQRTPTVSAAGDPEAPRLPTLRIRVWDGGHLLLLSQRRGEHRGRWGHQTLFGTGAGELEPADSEQLPLPPHKSQTNRPVGPGDPHPLRCPAASQVRAPPDCLKVHLKVLDGDYVVTFHLLFVLLLCRATLAVTGIFLLLVLTTLVGILPNREWVHYNSPDSLNTHVIVEIHVLEAQHW